MSTALRPSTTGNGHAAGDDTLRTLVRSAATALGKDDCLGRLGGDEFAAILCAASVRRGTTKGSKHSIGFLRMASPVRTFPHRQHGGPYPQTRP